MCDDFAARDSGPCRVMGKPHWNRTKMPNAPIVFVFRTRADVQSQSSALEAHLGITTAAGNKCCAMFMYRFACRLFTHAHFKHPPTSRTSFGHEMRADNLNSRFHFLKARLTLLIKYSLLSIPCTCRAQRGSTIMPFYYFTHSSLLQWRDAPSRALSQDGRSTG